MIQDDANMKRKAKLFIDQCPEERNWHHSSGDGCCQKRREMHSLGRHSLLSLLSVHRLRANNGTEQGANALLWQNTSKMLSAAEKRRDA